MAAERKSEDGSEVPSAAIEQMDEEATKDKRSRKRQVTKRTPKNLSASNSKPVTKFYITVALLFGYFLAVMFLSLEFMSKIKKVTSEMNLLAQAEAYYGFALNMQREMIFDPQAKILNKGSFAVATDTLEQVSLFNQMLVNKHVENEVSKAITGDYISAFTSLY